MRYISALLHLVIISNVLAEETRCSKYDFEEKILEKLVRMEFNENQKHADFERINSAVGGKLEKMESLSADVNKSMKELDLKVNDAVSMVTDNATKVLIDLEKKISKLEKQIMGKLETKQETTRTVAFKARLRTTISVTNGQTIVYPVVMFNIGDGYDSSTGFFTSPVNGTYMFDVVLCPYANKYVTIAIVTDDEQDTVIFLNDGQMHVCSSADAVVVLKSGQQVKVKVEPNTSSGAKIRQDSSRWNTFSGVLIHT